MVVVRIAVVALEEHDKVSVSHQSMQEGHIRVSGPVETCSNGDFHRILVDVRLTVDESSERCEALMKVVVEFIFCAAID